MPDYKFLLTEYDLDETLISNLNARYNYIRSRPNTFILLMKNITYGQCFELANKLYNMMSLKDCYFDIKAYFFLNSNKSILYLKIYNNSYFEFKYGRKLEKFQKERKNTKKHCYVSDYFQAKSMKRNLKKYCHIYNHNIHIKKEIHWHKFTKV